MTDVFSPPKHLAKTLAHLARLGTVLQYLANSVFLWVWMTGRWFGRKFKRAFISVFSIFITSQTIKNHKYLS